MDNDRRRSGVGVVDEGISLTDEVEEELEWLNTDGDEERTRLDSRRPGILVGDQSCSLTVMSLRRPTAVFVILTNTAR
jgi:hypothetical protein